MSSWKNDVSVDVVVANSIRSGSCAQSTCRGGALDSEDDSDYEAGRPRVAKNGRAELRASQDPGARKRPRVEAEAGVQCQGWRPVLSRNPSRKLGRHRDARDDSEV